MTAIGKTLTLILVTRIQCSVVEDAFLKQKQKKKVSIFHGKQKNRGKQTSALCNALHHTKVKIEKINLT